MLAIGSSFESRDSAWKIKLMGYVEMLWELIDKRLDELELSLDSYKETNDQIIMWLYEEVVLVESEY